MKGGMWMCARFIKEFQPDKAAMMMEVKSRKVANRKSLSAFTLSSRSC